MSLNMWGTVVCMNVAEIAGTCGLVGESTRAGLQPVA
jgi:hypothetical protein